MSRARSTSYEARAARVTLGSAKYQFLLIGRQKLNLHLFGDKDITALEASIFSTLISTRQHKVKHVD